MAPNKPRTKRNKQQETVQQAIRAAATPIAPLEPYHLSPEREAELTQEAESLGDNLLLFPGNLARRVMWSSRIQRAAERDAEDLVKTPFPDEEPPITHASIHGFRDQIEFLRSAQSRWRARQQSQEKASAHFEKHAEEAGRHKQLLLRFFDVRFKNSVDGQKRLSAIRAGSGDADLVQDVSDILLLCAEHAAAVQRGPRGEGAAATRLVELSPLLSRLLADKILSPEAQKARKSRDAAYTLVMTTERRLRGAAEYWYFGTDKMKDYAAFPVTSGAATADDDDAPTEEAPQPSGNEAVETGSATPPA
jgi:hypothetical protein